MRQWKSHLLKGGARQISPETWKSNLYTHIISPWRRNHALTGPDQVGTRLCLLWTRWQRANRKVRTQYGKKALLHRQGAFPLESQHLGGRGERWELQVNPQLPCKSEAGLDYLSNCVFCLSLDLNFIPTMPHIHKVNSNSEQFSQLIVT